MFEQLQLLYRRFLGTIFSDYFVDELESFAVNASIAVRYSIKPRAKILLWFAPEILRKVLFREGLAL
jgi:hypothetical protein